MSMQELLLHISPVAWNNCSAAISSTTKSSAGSFLQFVLLDLLIWIFATFGCKDTLISWSTAIPPYFYPTLKHRMPQFMLLSTLEYNITLPDVAVNGERHVEYVLYTFVYYLYVLNKAMICHLRVIFETHCFFFLDKILIFSFCHYPIFMQFCCIDFTTDSSQI